MCDFRLTLLNIGTSKTRADSKVFLMHRVVLLAEEDKSSSIYSTSPLHSVINVNRFYEVFRLSLETGAK